MGNPLPSIEPGYFRNALKDRSPEPLSESSLDALWIHFQEIRRWNPKLSLIGPSSIEDILDRHYGESLAALGLLDEKDRSLVDVGSGGGFPGFVLAAARPDLEVVLVEPRERKWAFLMTAVRRAGLSSRVVNARVERPPNTSQGTPETLDLPDSIDVVTLRALAASPDLLETLHSLAPRARFLLWRGKDPLDSPSLFRSKREIPLRGEHRKIVELVADPPNP